MNKNAREHKDYEGARQGGHDANLGKSCGGETRGSRKPGKKTTNEGKNEDQKKVKCIKDKK